MRVLDGRMEESVMSAPAASIGTCNCWNCKHLVPAMCVWIVEALGYLGEASALDEGSAPVAAKGRELLQGQVRRIPNP